MDKRHLVQQLTHELGRVAAGARYASQDAAQEARDGATAKERRSDTRVALEYGNLAFGQQKRALRVEGEMRAIRRMKLERLTKGAPIEVGAVVEVEDEETKEGRTFFLAAAGAGINLSGPGGDGRLTVVTPASPVGKAVVGRRVGDVIDVTVKGQIREWLITWVE